MTKKQIERIIEAKYDDYVGRIMREFKNLPDECRQSGDDGLSDVWEEFKSQIQGEQSIFFSAYEATIEDNIANLLRAMPAHEINLLWFMSEGRWDHEDDEDLSCVEDVANEIYRRVCDVAMNEPLAADEEELRIGKEDLKFLYEISDLLANMTARLESDSDDEVLLQEVIEDLSNLPTTPINEWKVRIVQQTPEFYTWSITGTPDKIALDCGKNHGEKPETKIRWQLGENVCRKGSLKEWLDTATRAVAEGAKLDSLSTDT